MNFGDFASVVQLGVGLHVGTALLQMYGDIGLQPMIRSISRLKSVAEDTRYPPTEAHEDRLEKLISDFEIFKIRMFNEYSGYLLINSAVAVILISALVTMAYLAQTPISGELSVVLVAASVLPAPVTLLCLWRDASRELKPLKSQADALEKEMIG